MAIGKVALARCHQTRAIACDASVGMVLGKEKGAIAATGTVQPVHIGLALTLASDDVTLSR